MDKFILGKKLGMTTLYNEEGAQNVTLIECESKVSLLRKKEKNGYDAVQLEIPKTKRKNVKVEFRVGNTDLKIGDVADVSLFRLGEKAKVSGISKAKGFQGVVKRHGFAGGSGYRNKDVEIFANYEFNTNILSEEVMGWRG